MPKDTKEIKLKQAMLTYLDRLCTEGQPADTYTERERNEARLMALGSGLVYDEPRAQASLGSLHITWKGLQFRQRVHHPIQFWLKNNWFPAIVAAMTIVSSITSAVIAFLR